MLTLGENLDIIMGVLLYWSFNMKKVIGLMIGLVPVSVFGECVPVPDCASIGYTETSCDGGSVKCPFDTTKLKCIPCDSSFRYTCSGDNIKNPLGDTCNNKYTACECIAGATFTNGKCICDTSCNTIGNIYYSDGSCSSCNITDKTPVGIIAYKDNNKHLIISLDTSIKMTWSAEQTDTNGNIIITYNTDLSELNNFSNSDLALQDFSGFDNTQIIVEAYGENATGVAAVYCYNYAPAGLESSKGKWYLPATGELYDVVFNNKEYINNALSALGINALNTDIHWSSSEYSYGNTWIVRSRDGNVNPYHHKNYSNTVSCLLAI